MDDKMVEEFLKVEKCLKENELADGWKALSRERKEHVVSCVVCRENLRLVKEVPEFDIEALRAGADEWINQHYANVREVRWLSRHDLSPAQIAAIHTLHGNVEIEKDPVSLDGDDALVRYCDGHAKAFVYAVASGLHYVAAAFAGSRFGTFLNHPQKRLDGQFGLSAVIWMNYPTKGKFERVWVNPDPNSDNGEALIPVARLAKQ